jgi:hypothetical protein
MIKVPAFEKETPLRMIRTLLLLSMLLTGASGAAAQETCARNVEPQGGFSLCVPDGWTVSEREGEKYKLLFAPPGERFTANINMKDSVSAMALDEYVATSVDYILKNYTQFGATTVKALTRDSFPTKTGVTGIKATFRTEYKGFLIRTIQYYFSGKATEKLTLTCTLLETDQVTFDPICDRAAKTFQLEEKTIPPKE